MNEVKKKVAPDMRKVVLREIKAVIHRGTVFARNGEARVVTHIGDDGSTNDDSTIHHAALDADGFATRGSAWISPWDFTSRVQKGEIQFIDGARAVLHVTLPPEWQKSHEARLAAVEAAEQARIESGRDGLNDREPVHHPSFGMARLSRSSGGHGRLFGSPFDHHTRIDMDIYRASERRNLSNTHHMQEDVPLLSVAFSEAQFAALIFSVAVGEGVPCTLDYVFGQRMPPPPPSQEVAEFKADVQRTLTQAGARVTEAAAKVQAALGPDAKPTKALLRDVANLVSQVERAFNDSIPFTVAQFNERMEKIVHAGKLEIEAYIAQRRTAGALTEGEEPLALPEAKKE
jgi:hypothetical protein